MKELMWTALKLLASFACPVHCLIVGGISMFRPFLGITGEVSHEFEVFLWLLSLIGAGTYIWQERKHWVRVAGFSTLAIVGTVGLIFHVHDLLHVGSYGIGLGAIYMLILHLRSPRCDHSCG